MRCASSHGTLNAGSRTRIAGAAAAPVTGATWRAPVLGHHQATGLLWLTLVIVVFILHPASFSLGRAAAEEPPTKDDGSGFVIELRPPDKTAGPPRKAGALPELRPGLSDEHRRGLLEAGKVRAFPPRAWENRLVKETMHYRIETNTSEETVVYLQAVLEAAYSHFGRRFGFCPPECLNVFIFSNRRDFARVAKEINYPVGETMAGFHTIIGDRAKSGVYLPWINQWDLEPTGTLMHETFHQFWMHTFGHIFPLWLNEGLAAYFEASRFDGEKITDGAIRAGYLLVVQQMVKGGKPLGLVKMVETEQKDWGFVHYATGWAFVYWMAWGQDTPAANRARQKKLSAYVATLVKPQNVTRAAFEQAMGFTLEEVEPAFHKWILSLDADGAYGGKLNPQRRR